MARKALYVGVMCSEEGCERQAVTRGMCKPCYDKKRQSGRLPLLESKVCSVCGDKHNALGFCVKHYNLYRRNGEVIYVRPPLPEESTELMVNLYKSGYTLKQIGQHLHCSSSTVQYRIKGLVTMRSSAPIPQQKPAKPEPEFDTSLFRRCNRCKEVKPKDREHFYGKREGLAHYCKPCADKFSMESRRRNREISRSMERFALGLHGELQEEAAGSAFLTALSM